jgi:hypothetical protein
MKRVLFITIIILFIVLEVAAEPVDYKIGVYYFPGWKDRQPHAPAPYPWERIKKYPEREPLLGWYDEGSDPVMKQQIDWMHAYGIKFVVFDWYYGKDKKVYLEHALASFLRSPNRKKLQFSILWANHDRMPASIDDWKSMVRYWVQYYFQRPEFMKLDGMPVVFIFSADLLKKQAESFGMSSKDLLISAETIARAGGLPGINFIAGTEANMPMISSYAKLSGYAAFSAYNYQRGSGDARESHSYSELDRGYQSHWQRFSDKGNLPLIVPMTSGWNKRPWGGSKDPAHDNSLGTPEEFRKHLNAAKRFMDANATLTRRMGVICCWNEYGEGSFIEPTDKMGFRYLEQVRDAFGMSPVQR